MSSIAPLDALSINSARHNFEPAEIGEVCGVICDSNENTSPKVPLSLLFHQP